MIQSILQPAAARVQAWSQELQSGEVLEKAQRFCENSVWQEQLTSLEKAWKQWQADLFTEADLENLEKLSEHMCTQMVMALMALATGMPAEERAESFAKSSSLLSLALDITKARQHTIVLSS